MISWTSSSRRLRLNEEQADYRAGLFCSAPGAVKKPWSDYNFGPGLPVCQSFLELICHSKLSCLKLNAETWISFSI